jgi:hypothetical protein
LRYQLQQDEIVVAIGDDARKVIGFGEDQAMRVVLCVEGREFAAELQGGCDSFAQLREVLIAGEGG